MKFFGVINYSHSCARVFILDNNAKTSALLVFLRKILRCDKARLLSKNFKYLKHFV